MIELPESNVLARQINEVLRGKQITGVVAAHDPHKFAWYYGDPEYYPDVLMGKVLHAACSYGGMVEILCEQAAVLLFSDGVGLRYHSSQDKMPEKHQLLIQFNDGSALSATVQMYGGLCCFRPGEYENPYYTVAKEKPSPLSEQFDKTYFDQLFLLKGTEKLSAKAFLATEQRIPGLGNGVLQDILWNAMIHPKRKISTFTDSDKDSLFQAIKTTLKAMADQGGRDTEKDLFGSPGGYKTMMSKNTVTTPCPVCGTIIKKESYLGGSVYYCTICQELR